MNKNLALVLALLGAALLGVFLLTRRPAGAPRPVEHSAARSTENRDLPTPMLSKPGRSAEGREPISEADRPPPRQSLGSDVRWISGRILSPLDVPDDEDLLLFATSFGPGEDEDRLAYERHVTFTLSPWNKGAAIQGSTAQWQELACEVQSDGTFRAPFPTAATTGVLRLDGRYQYAKTVVVDLTAPDPTPTLEPQLGAWLTGELTTDSSAAAGLGSTQLGEITIQIHSLSPNDSGRTIFTPLELRNESTFEARGLRAHSGYSLMVQPQEFKGSWWARALVAPGEHVALSLPLDAGARLSGSVLDVRGAAIADALVTASEEDEQMEWLVHEHSTHSDSDGAFSLAGLTQGRTRLLITAPGFLEVAVTDLDLVDGGLSSGLEVRLERGAGITGRVTWPDGEAAAGIAVRVVETVNPGGRTHNRPFVEHDTLTGSDGHFGISGLGTSTVKIVATTDELELMNRRSSSRQQWYAQVSAGEPARSGSRGGDEPAPAGWRAELSEVETGTEVALVLAPPVRLEGRVVDDIGAPIRAFSIRVWNSFGNETLSRPSVDFEAQDGRFVLEHQAQGEWFVTARADDHEPDVQVVSVPGGAPPEFVCERLGSVTGSVTDVAGQPIASASVGVLNLGNPSDMHEPIHGGTQTTADGRFILSGLSPGSVTLYATHADWASGESVEVEVRLGDNPHEVHFVLVSGGALEGVVYDSRGARDGARQLVALSLLRNGQDFAMLQADARGEFAREHLRPGRYLLRAMARSDELDPPPRPVRFEIIEGEAAHVSIGGVRPATTRVHGHVTRAGSPPGAGIIGMLREGGAPGEDMVGTELDASGAYELNIEGPGRYTLIVGLESGPRVPSFFPVEIPEVAEHLVNLALPLGRITGRVLDPQGAPAVGAHIKWSGWSSIPHVEALAYVKTDVTGSFELSGLVPGSYTLRASLEPHAIAVASGLTLEAEGALEGIQLRLQSGTTIEGRVFAPELTPAANAILFFRDAQGRVLNPLSSTRTDSEGRFSFTSAGAGAITASARLGQLAAPESEPVQVAPGLSAHVRLRLEPGTLLVVGVRDASGGPAPGIVRVFDSAGRAVHGLLGEERAALMKVEGLSSTEQRLGPLVPGPYRIEISAPDGRTLSRTVTLTGEPELRLELKVPE